MKHEPRVRELEDGERLKFRAVEAGLRRAEGEGPEPMKKMEELAEKLVKREKESMDVLVEAAGMEERLEVVKARFVLLFVLVTRG
jgi:hypothetical protein